MAKKKTPKPAGELVSVRIPLELRRRTKTLAASVDRRFQDMLAELLEKALKSRGA